MAASTKKIKCKTARLSKRKDGIFHLKYFDGTIVKSRELSKILVNIQNNSKEQASILLDHRVVYTNTLEAFTIFRNTSIVSRLALLTRKGVNEKTAHVYKRAALGFPVELFTEEDKAINWLKDL